MSDALKTGYEIVEDMLGPEAEAGMKAWSGIGGSSFSGAAFVRNLFNDSYAYTS